MMSNHDCRQQTCPFHAEHQANSSRVNSQASDISIETLQSWYDRGASDVQRDRPCLFRKIGAKYYANGDAPPDWTVEEENAYGEAYSEGWSDNDGGPS